MSAYSFHGKSMSLNVLTVSPQLSIGFYLSTCLALVLREKKGHTLKLFHCFDGEYQLKGQIFFTPPSYNALKE